MEDNNQLFPEEDEDLEALRNAALQSLKKKNEQMLQVRDPMTHFNGSPRNKKRGKFQRLSQNRSPRNGSFNGWTRNSNLITVPVVTEEMEQASNKLILPQDRYCNAEKSEESSDQLSSKFDRYDNSNSESESDEETKTNLIRSDSLEALMNELENEIQGKTAKEDKPKAKKKRKLSNVSAPAEPIKENLKPEEPIKKAQPFQRQRKWQPKPRPPRNHHLPAFAPPPPEILPPPAFVPPPTAPFEPIPFQNPVYVPVFEAPPPLFHVAPPTPLVIENNGFSVAPLSPRSAAFVLENRAIVEKRKRRSYSRSPSPLRLRRSHSPRASPRRSTLKRRSLSPSPVRRVVPPKKAPINVRERLGAKEELDPVLEARRKKFERKEIGTEGVIRLKKEEEEEEVEKKEEIDEEALLEGDDESILLDTIDLFSDEESDSDNEGRFKMKQKNDKEKIAVLPFTKLVNGGVKSEVGGKLEEKRKSDEERRKRRRMRRSRTPAKKALERKIEIKIRNPAKYEKTEERKVEVEEAPASDGDLRAQLSRKRAERQKNPAPEVVPSRLLQTALQSVVKKEKTKEENPEGGGKLPIRMRLGLSANQEAKKSRPLKKNKEQDN